MKAKNVQGLLNVMEKNPTYHLNEVLLLRQFHVCYSQVLTFMIVTFIK